MMRLGYALGRVLTCDNWTELRGSERSLALTVHAITWAVLLGLGVGMVLRVTEWAVR